MCTIEAYFTRKKYTKPKVGNSLRKLLPVYGYMCESRAIVSVLLYYKGQLMPVFHKANLFARLQAKTGITERYWLAKKIAFS